jgi:hypothetical protein
MSKRGGGAIGNAFKFGFGAASGFALVQVIFLLVGIAFFIPGLVMLSKEKKKPQDQKNQTNLIIAFILMGIGSVLGLGLGAGFLFSNILSEL